MATRLRGNTKPTNVPARLKMLLSGPAGCGKTTAAIQMPRPYLIDTENGASHYGDKIEKVGGAVFASSMTEDIITELRALMTEDHPYKTVIIDPISIAYQATVDAMQAKYPNSFQAFGEAGKLYKRLCNLIAAIDMNVVVTAHAKAEYEVSIGDDGKSRPEQVGTTFDGYKKLNHFFDLWLELHQERNGTRRTATVRKTRLPEFGDAETFDWSYDDIVKRYGSERLESGVKTIHLASAEQIARFNALHARLSEAEIKELKIDKALSTVESVEDLTAERIAKAIELMDKRLNVAA